MPTLYHRALVWDAHSCLPLVPDADVSLLARHKAAGIDYVSINIGMHMTPLDRVIRTVAHFRDWIRRHPRTMPTEILLRHGYREADLLGILGGNFLRAAGAAWG
ncbi:dipeptidase [Inquilinus limosus]|uniref:hypothetical protein n=1 Tax=Inquilinus limosus TaxID=171674 RepID=UPI003F17DA2D